MADDWFARFCRAMTPAENDALWWLAQCHDVDRMRRVAQAVKDRIDGLTAEEARARRLTKEAKRG